MLIRFWSNKATGVIVEAYWLYFLAFTVIGYPIDVMQIDFTCVYSFVKRVIDEFISIWLIRNALWTTFALKCPNTSDRIRFSHVLYANILLAH